jgi:hypothetical protein
MLNLIYGRGGRNKMIFAAICIVAGILLFVFYDNLQNQRVSFFGFEVLHNSMETFGKYGFCGFYVFAGTAIGIWGFVQHRKDKESSSQ